MKEIRWQDEKGSVTVSGAYITIYISCGTAWGEPVNKVKSRRLLLHTLRVLASELLYVIVILLGAHYIWWTVHKTWFYSNCYCYNSNSNSNCYCYSTVLWLGATRPFFVQGKEIYTWQQCQTDLGTNYVGHCYVIFSVIYNKIISLRAIPLNCKISTHSPHLMFR